VGDCPAAWDPRSAQEPLIYSFWHEGVLTIIPHWRDSNIQGLASLSFDGALIAGAMRYLGYPTVARGSSSRGGAGALKAHLDALEQGRHVAISVDGPRGPAYVAKPGLLQLAALSGRRIIPVGSATTPDWRLKNWDRTQVPPPFSRLSFCLGEPLSVSKGGEEQGQRDLQAAMLQVQAKAANLLI
jgi:lysophospholipid acyltransferase (LPLAT)-like uncharacterized protein